MPPLTSREILSKIDDTPGFTETWSRLFFHELFIMSPGAAPLIGEESRQRRMASELIEMVLAELREEPLRDDTADGFGGAHAETGILSLHMKVARGPVMRAAAGACHELTADEVVRFGEAYDAIVSRIAKHTISLEAGGKSGP